MIPVTTLLQWGSLAAILIATWQIIQPFMGSTLLAAVLVVSTWPVHDLMEKRISGAATRATILIIIWLVVLALPLAWLGYVLAENANTWVATTKLYLDTHGLPLHVPEFIQKLPFIGQGMDAYWFKLTRNKEEVTRILQTIASPARDFGWDGIRSAMNAIVQLLLVLFIAWFMYYDGRRLVGWMRLIAARLGDKLGIDLLCKAGDTVRAVMLGLIGSALGQSLVMAFGLWVSGVPQIGLLSAATFFLSLIPGGPFLVWGGACLWLYWQDHMGWMIFLMIWGFVVVSSVDNIVKPIIMSKGSKQSLLLMTLGVFGGALAFGFIGLFLGPVILGVASSLVSVWLDDQSRQHPEVSSL